MRQGYYLARKRREFDEFGIEVIDLSMTTPEPRVYQEPKIVGGVSVASARSWPWQVSLRFNDVHVCGGSLVGAHYIVTAAHCFKETSSDINRWSIYLGKIRRSLGEETEMGPLRIVSINVHPQYGDKFNKKFDADIALLRMAVAVPFNQHIFPVCLPRQDEELISGQICAITGFGETKGTGGDGNLKEAKVPIVDHRECSNTSRRMSESLSDNMICAGYVEEGGTDSCQGDSGGPLVCPQGGAYVLQGVISWGFSCGAANAPGVYTRVSAYVDWLKQTVRRQSNDRF